MTTLAITTNDALFTCTGEEGITVRFKRTHSHAEKDAVYSTTRRTVMIWFHQWECLDCGKQTTTLDDGTPDVGNCINGHCACLHCGKVLPRLKCGCPRPHSWNHCPGKTEADKLYPQHSQPGGHRVRND